MVLWVRFIPWIVHADPRETPSARRRINRAEATTAAGCLIQGFGIPSGVVVVVDGSSAVATEASSNGIAGRADGARRQVEE